jgi:hypothetical protein
MILSSTSLVLAAFLLSGAGQEQKPADLLKEDDGLEFRFGVYPSLDRLRLMVLRPPAAFKRWEVLLSTRGGAELARCGGDLPFPKSGETMKTPPLAAGAYDVQLVLSAPDGTRREVRRGFERERFEWENSPLGRDRIILPPFTPLAVDAAAARVECVLRRHELDGAGLWKRVSSQGRDLLASPLRLEVEAEGRTHAAAGGAVTFAEKSPDRVTGEAAWSAGPFRGRTAFQFDYDGVVRTTLHLEPSETRLEALRLVVPMKTSETWLMHPVTDLLRFHYAGRIPDGSGTLWDYGGKRREVRYTETGRPDADGKVWDSHHVGRHQIPAPFVPYIWLGGPERGICWFAENDRDWSVDRDKPVLEIRRQGDVTSLVVRFVTRPVAMTRARTITFGLMATPAKPMPESPVSFRRWWTGEPGPDSKDVVQVGFMGACYYWGAPGPCYAFYPAFRDFGIFDEFARLRRGGARDPGFTDRWLSRFTAPEYASEMKTYRAHVDWSVNYFSGGKWKGDPGAGRTAYVMPYTNARAINWGAEARTFADEWSTIDVADPRWPCEERLVRNRSGGFTLAAYGKAAAPLDTGGIAYAVDPVPSWQDMVLHYLQKMLGTFADGVYFDDFFLSPNYSPFGPGYVDDEGALRPGVNIFAFRDLVRRLAVMQHQAGRRPLVFLHMTNANIVPMLSFGTILLDHEWRDQGDFKEKDFHERLNLDDDCSLLLAQSTGLQSGCLGVVHDLFHGKPSRRRSALGAALTHEMRFSASGDADGSRVGGLLCGFGYGRPDCRVWRWWDDGLPVKASGAPAKTLALARGGKAMIVVASYGPEGEVTLDLDLKALGLPEGAAARNAETGATVRGVAPGRYALPLARHDFCVVGIE